MKCGETNRKKAGRRVCTCAMMPSLPGCLSSSLGMRWMERLASFTVGTMPSLPFIGSESEPGPRGGEPSLFICLGSLLR